MSFIGTVCGKIQTRKIKNGLSHNLMLVHNKRNYMTGKAEFEIVFNFGTVRSYHLPDRAASMWKKINFVLDTLAAKGDIYRNDAARAKAKFGELLGPDPGRIAPPVAPAPVPTAKPKPKSSLSAEERLRERFPDLF